MTTSMVVAMKDVREEEERKSRLAMSPSRDVISWAVRMRVERGERERP